MKFCTKCKMMFQDDKNYCPNCGIRLESSDYYDIFGEKIERKERVHQDNTIFDKNQNDINDNGKINLKDFKNIRGEILSFFSLGTFFIPTFGFLIALVASFFNSLEYRIHKKNLGYFVLSIICLILSIIFEILLLKFKIV